MQAPQRMQRSMSFKPSFSIRDRPLSTSTMWNSSGPSRSPGPFGPQWNVVYWVMSPPVAERTRSRSMAKAWAIEGTSFSMPAVTMCTRGGVVVSSALPSFVTVQVAPVSATRKLAPETFAQAWADAERIRTAGLPVLPHQEQALAQAGTDLDRLRPNGTEDEDRI